MKKILLLTATMFVFIICKGQTPTLEFVLDLNVDLKGEVVNIGTTPDGSRTIIPITGGTFEGPNIKGTILNGGADYQLHSSNTQLTQLNAIYSIRTDDGVDIFVNNKGVIGTSPDGKPYFFTSPHFDAPVESKYNWLNQQVFVCKPVGFGQGNIILRVWRVCDGNFAPNTTATNKELSVTKFSSPDPNLFKDIKHKGTVEEFRYDAIINGEKINKRAQIYLPFGYNPNDKSKKYNVVYLIHGGGDNTTSFFADPRSPLPLTSVLDYLISENKMEPMIVVAPTFYNDDTNIGPNTFESAVEQTRVFNQEMHNYIIPAVEKAYNTYFEGSGDSAIENSRDHRAFGGFSMGALTTWYQMAYALNDVKHFIPLSGDLWIYDNKGNKMSANVAASWLNDQISASKHANDFMVFGYTGTDDIAGTPEHLLFEGLTKHAPLFRVNVPNANAVFVMKDGGKHYYGDINEYLYEVLPLIWPKN